MLAELRRSDVRVFLLSLLVVLCVGAPFFVRAFPFGGQTQVHHYCYNSAIYALLGPPRGGPYIWTPSTKTYQFGPPRGVGQWLLGLTGPPYYCIVTRSPIYVKEGISIMMMGSSGPAAPGFSPYNQASYGGGYSQGSYSSYSQASYKGYSQSSYSSYAQAAYTQPTIGHVVISEVYAHVDPAYGSEPGNEWVEIYNGATTAVDLSGWIIADASSTDALPSGVTLAPGKMLVVTGTTTTRTLWTLDENIRVVSINGSIGNGLAANGDSLTLKKPDGTMVDDVSWGTNKRIMNPSAPAFVLGRSLMRKALQVDSDTASDWTMHSNPNPGL